VTVVEAPRRSDLVVQLLKNLKPQLVVTSLADYEMRTSTAFELLLDATASIGARLILDISEYLELSSLPGTNGVLQFLASHPMPMHATIVCGLVKNQVSKGLMLVASCHSVCLDFVLVKGLLLKARLVLNQQPLHALGLCHLIFQAIRTLGPRECFSQFWNGLQREAYSGGLVGMKQRGPSSNHTV